MTPVISNQQDVVTTPSTPVLNMEGKFVVSDVKTVAALQNKFRGQASNVFPLVGQQMSFAKAIAWEIGAIIGFGGIGSNPEKADRLQEEFAKYRQEVQANLDQAA